MISERRGKFPYIAGDARCGSMINEYIDHFSQGGNFTLEELARSARLVTAFLVM